VIPETGGTNEALGFNVDDAADASGRQNHRQTPHPRDAAATVRRNADLTEEFVLNMSCAVDDGAE
jgi:hypothetical protein